MSEIVERYKVDHSTLSEPYVAPTTLKWAIEREQNMQKFAKKLIEELSTAEARIKELEPGEVNVFDSSKPLCCFQCGGAMVCNCACHAPEPCRKFVYGGYEVGSGGPIACKVCGEDIDSHAPERPKGE